MLKIFSIRTFCNKEQEIVYIVLFNHFLLSTKECEICIKVYNFNNLRLDEMDIYLDQLPSTIHLRIETPDKKSKLSFQIIFFWLYL